MQAAQCRLEPDPQQQRRPDQGFNGVADGDADGRRGCGAAAQIGCERAQQNGGPEPPAAQQQHRQRDPRVQPDHGDLLLCGRQLQSEAAGGVVDQHQGEQLGDERRPPQIGHHPGQHPGLIAGPGFVPPG